MEPVIESNKFDHLIQRATVHPCRLNKPSTTLCGIGVGAGRADGVNCRKIDSSLQDNASADRFSFPSTCRAIMEKSCHASKKNKQRNMWAILFSLQYPEDNTDTTAMLS